MTVPSFSSSYILPPILPLGLRTDWVTRIARLALECTRPGRQLIGLASKGLLRHCNPTCPDCRRIHFYWWCCIPGAIRWQACQRGVLVLYTPARLLSNCNGVAVGSRIVSGLVRLCGNWGWLVVCRTGLCERQDGLNWWLKHDCNLIVGAGGVGLHFLLPRNCLDCLLDCVSSRIFMQSCYPW